MRGSSGQLCRNWRPKAPTGMLQAVKGDWERPRAVLGDALLAQLLDVPAGQLSRYAAGLTVPTEVAARLATVAAVVEDLAGGYNDDGIRRWFGRPRKALGGLAPGELLSGGFDPGSDGVARVRQLAASLVGSRP
jgi:hypothetical protein